MKSIITSLSLALVLLTAGCRPDTLAPIESDNTSLEERMQGEWKLSKVTIRDVNAENISSPFVLKDVTEIFPYKDFKVNLALNNGQAGGFTVVRGNSPAVIPFPTGTWQLLGGEKPDSIRFVNGANRVGMQLGSYPTSFSRSFSVRFSKFTPNADPTRPDVLRVVYEYQFTK